MDRPCPIDSKKSFDKYMLVKKTDKDFKESAQKTNKLENKIGDIF